MNMQSLKNTQATQTCTHTIVVMAEALERRATHGSATGVKAAAAAGAAAHRTSTLVLIPATLPLGGALPASSVSPSRPEYKLLLTRKRHGETRAARRGLRIQC